MSATRCRVGRGGSRGGRSFVRRTRNDRLDKLPAESMLAATEHRGIDVGNRGQRHKRNKKNSIKFYDVQFISIDLLQKIIEEILRGGGGRVKGNVSNWDGRRHRIEVGPEKKGPSYRRSFAR